ncbi:MAG: ComEA family DNA-binding protein [Carnobacterium sp.]|uniref:ComEA family DNA-binding protein n=1 Tax=Carnobacterium sp. TaxID=48221 RepID=UPI002FC7B062
MNVLLKKWKEKYQLISIISLGIGIMIVLGVLAAVAFMKPANVESTDVLTNYLEDSTRLEGREETDTNEAASSEEGGNKTDETKTIYVDIKGAVHLPGVYEVQSDLRLIDVIALAGGLLPTANQNGVNMAQKLADQMMIIIPETGAAEDETTNQTVTIVTPEEAVEEAGGKVNLNKATIQELQTLSGIGEKKAERILQYRQENGSFKTTEELKEVSGIGEKTFEALEAFITVGAE